MRPLPYLVLGLALCVVVLGTACPINPSPHGSEGEGEGEGEGEHYPEPNGDLVLSIGADNALEMGAFNVRNFPCGNSATSTVCRPSIESTPSLLADILYSLEVDLVSLEEVASVDAFNEVVARLPHHEGVLSDHEYGDGTYQKIGFIYDARRLTLRSSDTVFNNNFDFPRPALEGAFDYDDGENPPLSFIAIAVHLKAGEAAEDRDRRQGAVASLDDYVQQKVGGAGVDAVVALGDFNESLGDTQGQQVLGPLLDGGRYDFRTAALADQGAVSFIPSGDLIDHLVTTVELDDVSFTLGTVIPPLDDQVSGYRDLLSDHLPVFTKIQPR